MTSIRHFAASDHRGNISPVILAGKVETNRVEITTAEKKVETLLSVSCLICPSFLGKGGLNYHVVMLLILTKSNDFVCVA